MSGKRTRRVIHRLRSAAAFLSAIALFIVIAVWIRSYFVSDWIRFMSESEGPEREVIEDGHPVTHQGDSFEREWAIQSSRGRLALALEQRMNATTGSAPGFSWERIDPSPMDISGVAPLAEIFFDRVGFGFLKMREQTDPGESILTMGALVPCWFLALVSGVLPLVWLTRWRRNAIIARRRIAGQCTACGYDLRASPDRCPECGVSEALA